jgi:ABC-type antimicrobial peptide transport system permease subunit
VRVLSPASPSALALHPDEGPIRFGRLGALVGATRSVFYGVGMRYFLAIFLIFLVAALPLFPAVGLVSGVYPAWRAARVRPLESIRSEGD